MAIQSHVSGTSLHRSLRAGCAVIVGLGVVVTMALILFVGGVQARLIRPPLGELRLGPLALIGARVLAVCATPNLASCREDFFELKVAVRQSNDMRDSYRLMQISLK
jgi:hypothetical protein